MLRTIAILCASSMIATATITFAGEQFTEDASITAIGRDDQTNALATQQLKKEVTLTDAITVLTTYRKVTHEQYLVYAHQPGARGWAMLKDGTKFTWEIEPGYAALVRGPGTAMSYLLCPDIAMGK